MRFPVNLLSPAAPILMAAAVACASNPPASTAAPPAAASQGMDHGAMGASATSATSGTMAAPGDPPLPADATSASARLASSPRHGQYVMIATGPAPTDSIRAWVVYPQRSTRAPVVLVVHEIFGLSTWIRAVADQLAADGFIAIAPDLLSSQNLPGAPDSVSMQAGIAAVSKLDMNDVQRQLDAVARYGTTLPAALPKYGIVGFCWGGGVAFQYAVHAPTLGASVVYYGTSPKPGTLGSVRAPVLGNYAGNDARVNMTIAPADSALRALGKTYVPRIYEGAGHGFLRQQDGMSGANMAATRQAWPATIAWFRKYLGA